MAHEKRKHRGWEVIDPNRPKPRPFQVGTTEQEFSNLVAIAVSLGVEPRSTGVPHGKASFVVAMIRRIANGQLLVVHPAHQDFDTDEIPELELQSDNSVMYTSQATQKYE